MTLSKSYTFYSQSQNSLVWTVKDTNQQIVNNATVTATLFWGRDRINPTQTPGVAVPNFTSITLVFDSASQAYLTTIPILASAPPGGDYILVVDAVSNTRSQLSHWERPAVITEIGSQ